jgi:hypothetical protein
MRYSISKELYNYMEFYNLTDATYLLEFYDKKLVGKRLSHKTDYTITHLEIDDWDNGKYRLMAKASGTSTADVCDVVKLLNMVHPVTVLKEKVLKT